MKTIRILLMTAGLAAITTGVIVSALAKEKESSEKSVVGSIQTTERLKPSEMAELAKIPFDEALKAATSRVPGKVVKAKLKVEHGSLIYSFKVVGADKSITEVEVDAGNGKILDVDKD